MFATCLHCYRPLGSNREIAAFPVGNRIAFDAARGRLWVVCPSCHRWNLSPIEERWEAVEYAEKLYRDTTTRVATTHIGLAVRASGLSLVRIGAPLRPEFAAWRYGTQLRSRFRREWIERGISAMRDEIPDSPIVRTGLLSFIPGLAPLALPLIVANAVREVYRRGRRIPAVVIDHKPIDLRIRDLAQLRMLPDRETRWRLIVLHAQGQSVATGDDVLPLLSRLLPHMNDVGASSRQVSQAVAKAEYFRTVGHLLDFAVRSRDRASLPLVQMMGYEQRLALEMMTQEEAERRAMEGELDTLRDAWEEAERIASIADGLLVPAFIQRRLGMGNNRRDS